MALRIVTAEQLVPVAAKERQTEHDAQRIHFAFSLRLGIGKTSLLASIPLPESLFLDCDGANARSTR